MPNVDPKKLRNVLYAWVYTTVTQIKHPGAPPLGDQVVIDRQDLAHFQNAIAANPNAFGVVADALATTPSITGDWTGHVHPNFAELDSIFIGKN